MPENKHVQSVFRFVTVRGPKKKVQTATGTITYKLNSPFYTSIKAAAELADYESRREKLMALATELAAGKEYIRTETALAAHVGQDLLSFAEWLSKNREALTREKVKQQLRTVKSRLGGEKQAILWDHLFCGAIIGRATPVLNAIMILMNADHFISNYEKDEITDDPQPLPVSLKALALAEIILPQPFPLQYVSPAQELSGTRPADTGSEAIEWGLKAALYTAAAEELDAYHSRQRELAKNAARDTGSVDEVKRSPEKPGMIPDFKVLSAETQKMLLEIKATTGLGIDYLIRELQAGAAKCTARQFELAQTTKMVVRAGGALWSLDITKDGSQEQLKQVKHSGAPDDYDGFYFNDGKCRIRPLGIADYRRVEQELCCYKPGEVAHIENILQGEYKDRSTRRLRRTEDTFTVSRESEETSERDTTSTDRYEMQKETERVIQTDLSMELGTSVSGSYGPVTMSVNAGFAISSSTTLSDNQAVTYAKEVTERALERVVKRTREEQVTKIIEEFEENNKHGLDNRGGNKHVVGLYRWVDKIYKAKVVNYGKRLMFEFMIAEPGAFHLWAMSEQSSSATGVVLKAPVDPRSAEMVPILGQKFIRHVDITETNYAPLAALYGAQVQPPPNLFVAVERSYSQEKIENPVVDHFTKEYNDIKIPQGYDVEYAWVRAQIDVSNTGWAIVHVGEGSVSINGGNNTNNLRQGFATFLYNEQETMPVCIMGRTSYYGVTVNIQCKRSAFTYEEWQIKTYASIISAYENKQAQYEQSLAEARVQGGVNIRGTNPAINRTLEQQELKKQCLNWLYNGANFSTWAVWHYGHDGSPFWNTDCDAIAKGEAAKFMEQCFEWNLMTYKFLPYFYGAKSRWKKLYQLNDTDPQFLAFLQAGMARVLIPVRPGYEKQIMYFLRTGEVWGGEHVPAIDSPLYLSIVDELKQPLGTVEGEPWEVRVPTTLNVLQCESGCVDGKGLPCDCDPEGVFGVTTGATLTPVREVAGDSGDPGTGGGITTDPHNDDGHTHGG